MSASVWVTPAAPAHFPAVVSCICCVNKAPPPALFRSWQNRDLQIMKQAGGLNYRDGTSQKRSHRASVEKTQWLATLWYRMTGILGIYGGLCPSRRLTVFWSVLLWEGLRVCAVKSLCVAENVNHREGCVTTVTPIYCHLGSRLHVWNCAAHHYGPKCA